MEKLAKLQVFGKLLSPIPQFQFNKEGLTLKNRKSTGIKVSIFVKGNINRTRREKSLGNCKIDNKLVQVGKEFRSFRSIKRTGRYCRWVPKLQDFKPILGHKKGSVLSEDKEYLKIKIPWIDY